MDQNFLFRWIWRLNALGLLALLCFFAFTFAGPFLIMTGVLGATTGTVFFEPANEPSAGKPQPYELFLDYAREGRKEIVLALAQRVVIPAYPKFSGESSVTYDGYAINSADPRTIKNYLFVDPTTGASRWLFPTNKQTIASTDYANDTDAWSGVLPAATVKAKIAIFDVKPDDGKGKYQAYAAKVDGTQLTLLLSDLDDQPLGNVSDGILALRYETKGRQMVATFSMDDFKPIMTKDVTDLAAK